MRTSGGSSSPHYADKIDAELFSEEQHRIPGELGIARRDKEKASLRVEELGTVLDDAMTLARDSELLYENADGMTRRQLNQVVFTKLLVHGRQRRRRALDRLVRGAPSRGTRSAAQGLRLRTGSEAQNRAPSPFGLGFD